MSISDFVFSLWWWVVVDVGGEDEDEDGDKDDAVKGKPVGTTDAVWKHHHSSKPFGRGLSKSGSVTEREVEGRVCRRRRQQRRWSRNAEGGRRVGLWRGATVEKVELRQRKRWKDGFVEGRSNGEGQKVGGGGRSGHVVKG
ncbi:hypothetical protein E2542_SST19272 [Spatholobus suberectus]|nr:hypothetical protein E2542_SST19272 [Spatholobus suberectus]